MDLTVRVASDLSGVNPAAWDALEHGHAPFLRYGFLRALQVSGSIGSDSGWDPMYVMVERPPSQTGRSAQGAKLCGAVACFRKEHSYGEYIFDFGWARASMRAGVRYYPKMVVAAPVTPASGQRILLAPDLDEDTRSVVTRLLVGTVRELADELGCSSVHWLFTTEAEQEQLAELGYMSRASFQFHWHNPGYADFDAFLATLSSRKRKQIRKERRRAQAGVDEIEFVSGDAMTDDDVSALDRFYRSTTYRHGGQDYLRPGFFEALVEEAAQYVQFARVRKEDSTIAGALYLETSGALFGRYWGCTEDVDCLHFEVAYYQGIERCIARGLPLFEAGAQGEHKLLRGFKPSPTYSSHWIRHRGLRDAVSRFLREEAQALPPYMRELARFTPYKREPG